MTVKRASAPKWIEIDVGIGDPLVIGPAKDVAGWKGSAETDRIRVSLVYWQSLVPALPEPWRSQDPTHPFLLVPKTRAAEVVAELTAHALSKFPDLKKKKTGGITRLFSKDHEFQIYLDPEHEADLFLQGTEGREAWRAEDLLFWNVKHHFRAFARAEDQSIVILEAPETAEMPGELDLAKLPGPVTSHGEFTFSGLFAAINARRSLTDFKGVDTPGQSLTPFAGKKLKPRSSDDHAGLVFVADGRFRCETGGDEAQRWCRFTRSAA